MSAQNPGFDVESADPATGLTRRIEIKGTTGIWRETASVPVSSRQFEDARQPPEGVEYWLYVVDSESVIPIPWTRHAIAGYLFYAEDWAHLAEGEAPIGGPNADASAPSERGASDQRVGVESDHA